MSRPTPHDAKEVMDRLSAEGYRPILVGGMAIELAGFGGTKDVDVLLPEGEYGGAEYLRSDGIEVLSNTGNFTNGFLTLKNGRKIKWDVINPALFGGDEFYRFVETEGSRKSAIGRVALPSVVYYTRLMVDGEHGRRYILRIRRDLDEGAPQSWVIGTLGIARRFGTEKKIRAIVGERLRGRSSRIPSAALRRE